jgi:hypothetical protein
MWSWSRKAKMPRIARILCVISVIGGLSFPTYAERKYFLGATVDFTGGLSNQVTNTSYYTQENAPFYSVYPSLSLKSVGKNSTLDFGYTFSAERFEGTPALTTLSHVATMNFTAQLGNRTHLRFSDNFDTMPNYSTINVLQGFAITPLGFQYVFAPQVNKNFSMGDSGSIGFDVDLTTKSSLTFSGTGSYRHYDQSVSGSYYSDQARGEGEFGFSHKHSARTTWNVKYRIWQNEYDNFPTSRSQSATLGLSRVLSPSVTLTLEAGPAYIETSSYVSYVVDAAIATQFKTNKFSAGYSHFAGDTTGIGGTSESHQGRLGFSRTLWRTASINFQASAFRQNQSGISAYEYWGATGSAALSQQMGRHFVASGGVSYTTNLGNSQITYNNITYKRAYVSVGLRLPDLWKTEK